MTLSTVMEKFITCWGEMGTKWGVNRTVAEVHALFYLSPEALNAEDIAVTLSLARSNVSTSLRELQNWGLVKPAHFLGDRKQYYEAIKDPWEMFRVILNERKRREIDPTVRMLRECLEEVGNAAPENAYTRKRLHDALAFFEVVIPLYDELQRLPIGPIQNLLKLKAKVKELVRERKHA